MVRRRIPTAGRARFSEVFFPMLVQPRSNSVFQPRIDVGFPTAARNRISYSGPKAESDSGPSKIFRSIFSPCWSNRGPTVYSNCGYTSVSDRGPTAGRPRSNHMIPTADGRRFPILSRSQFGAEISTNLGPTSVLQRNLLRRNPPQSRRWSADGLQAGI